MALRIYLRLLDKYPMRTMSFTTGLLMGAGDGIAQICIEKNTKNYDYIRTGRFLGFGFFIGGPMFRTWYLVLDKAFKTSKYGPLKMLACDQLLWAPAFLSFFLSVMGIMRGDSASEIKQKVERDIVPVLLTNWKIWPAAQLVNFYYVPLQHRVLVVNFVAVGWNTYLAWKAEQEINDLSDETVTSHNAPASDVQQQATAGS